MADFITTVEKVASVASPTVFIDLEGVEPFSWFVSTQTAKEDDFFAVKNALVEPSTGGTAVVASVTSR